jgi:hypothetical protein
MAWRRHIKGLFIFFGSIAVGFGIGQGVAGVLRITTGDNDLALKIGTGAWILSAMVLFLYGGLWLCGADEIANPQNPASKFGRLRAAKAEGKLQTAELRVGFVFVMIGAATASMITRSYWMIAIVSILCGAVGGWVGYDVKRRVRGIRERSHTNQVSEQPAEMSEKANPRG